MSEADLQFKTDTRADYPRDTVGYTPLSITLHGFKDNVWLTLVTSRFERRVKAYTKGQGVNPEFVELLKNWEKLILQLKSMYDTIDGEEASGQNPFTRLPDLQLKMQREIPAALLRAPTQSELAQARLQAHLNPQPPQQSIGFLGWTWVVILTIFELLSGAKRR